MPRNVLIAAVMMALTLPSFDAVAGSLCQSAMFNCAVTAETTSGEKKRVFRGINLRKLIYDQDRSLRWVKRNCQLVDGSPLDCDWKRNFRQRLVPRGGAASPTPAARATAPTSPSRSTSAPAWRPQLPKAAKRAVRRAPTVQPAPIRAPIGAAKNRPFDADVKAAASRYKLPADFIAAVMTVESGGNPKAMSHVGAQGLMQLMPATAKAMGVTDPWNPTQNIMGGARFLRVLANRFGGDLVKVLSAYHAGSSRVKKRQGTPFSQTDRYVRKVLRVYYALRDG